jgi:hypothetical protein
MTPRGSGKAPRRRDDFVIWLTDQQRLLVNMAAALDSQEPEDWAGRVLSVAANEVLARSGMPRTGRKR